MKKKTSTTEKDAAIEAFEELEGEAGEGPPPDEDFDLPSFGDPASAETSRSEKPKWPDEQQPEFTAAALAPDVPVQLVAVLAKKIISMKDLIAFRMGHVVDLQRPPSETVDLVANGKLVARGELVEIDGKLGVRIVKLVR